ncbi:transmembrane protein 182 isoform X2 [Rhinatrema bivittatum]|uniref:transmembrane protein 182 isoform X2 n=1 Tax=Rhinatrema bivittatum TaxID=194408 RepID=UPI0011276FBA|nr:transmembrane protein 182 isoform X2 [Rhinatrema bivittatum]
MAPGIFYCIDLYKPRDEAIVPIAFHHEGFFWRCWFEGFMGESAKSMWNFWFTNQSPSKNCTHAYLSPFPINRENHNSSSTYESAVIYRGFWSIFMLLGVVTILAAGFLIICAAPFASQKLYKVGGVFFITAGILYSLVVVMYVIWVQGMADLDNYMNSRKEDCPDFTVYVRYGWSFILAPIGIFFSLFAGMLFLLVGRTIQIYTS